MKKDKQHEDDPSEFCSDVGDDIFDDAEVTLTNRCNFCGDTDEVDIDMMGDGTFFERCAKATNDAGWKMRDSEKYGCIDLCCPSCIELQDEDL